MGLDKHQIGSRGIPSLTDSSLPDFITLSSEDLQLELCFEDELRVA